MLPPAPIKAMLLIGFGLAPLCFAANPPFWVALLIAPA